MQRGSDRLNVHRDDEMKHELQGQLRAERPTRAEVWDEAEPPAEDDPAVAESPQGGESQEELDEAFRFELARHVRPTIYPTRRRELLHALHEEQAPDWLVRAVEELPREGSYANVQEVVATLGRRPRS